MKCTDGVRIPKKKSAVLVGVTLAPEAITQLAYLRVLWGVSPSAVVTRLLAEDAQRRKR